MSLRTLIDRIEPWAKGWERSSGTKSILQLIQDAQDDLFDYDSPGMIFIPSDNKGMEPYLKTTAGTYVYEVINANLSATLSKTLNGTAYDVRCRRVLGIFTEPTYPRPYGMTAPSYPYPYGLNISVADPEKVCEFFPPTETDAAKVVFKDDPGSTTTTYFIRFVFEPARLTAESIPLMVPTSMYQGIMEYCIGQIQFFANGKYNEMQKMWENKWKPRFRAEMSWTTGADGSLVEPIIA